MACCDQHKPKWRPSIKIRALSINVAKQAQIEEKEHPYECHVAISTTTTSDDHDHLDYISTRNQAGVELNLGHTFSINFIAL